MLKTIKCLLFLLLVQSFVPIEMLATTYYSRASGNWNANGSWSTVTYGNATNTGTFPIAGDSALIDDGHTITINTTSACAVLTIGQGTSGIVVYTSSGAKTLTLTGDLKINSGGKFWYNSNAGRVHTLNIGGNIDNAGTLDFYYDSNDLVNITFSNGNASVIGSGSWDLYNITVSKTATPNTLEVTSTTFEAAIRNTFSLTTGTYIHNNTSTFSCNPSLNGTISETSCVKIPAGTMNFSANSNYLYLQGSLYINGGSCTVGKAAGGVGIASDQNGAAIPYLEVSSGTLNVNGGINCRNTATTEPFHFKMTGGQINLQTGSTASAYEGFKITDVASSTFEMYGGIIEFEQANTSSSFSLPDFDFCGTNGTVYSTNGIIQFGNSNTSPGTLFSFKPYTSEIYPHFRVSNGVLSPSIGSGNSAHFQLQSLQIDAGCEFDVRSISGTVGDSKDMYIRSSINNNAFINNGTFTRRSGAVIFQDDTLQRIGGSAVSQFEDFTINNATNVTLDTSITINGVLTLTNGLINTTSTDLLTAGNSSTIPIGSSTSYVNGPMQKNIASSLSTTLNFPIGANGFYRPIVLTVKHSSASQAYYWGQLVNSPAAALPYSLPVAFSKVSNVRYWQFVRTGASNFTNSTAKLYYGIDDGVTDPTNLRVGQGVSATWSNEGGTGSASYVGNITSSSFTTFTGIFTLANTTGGSNALPVEFTSFEVESIKSGNLLNWATATEINNDYFEILRSFNGLDFEVIHRQIGAGNSTQLKEYSYLDETSSAKLTYYQLRQVDYDGKYSYSEIRCVKASNVSINLFPTISNGENIFLSIESLSKEQTTLKLVNDMGTLFSQQNFFLHDSIVRLENTTSLSNGRYYAVIETANSKKVILFYIQK